MSAGSPDSSSLFRHRPFLLYFGGRLFSNFSRQIVAVAVGWQVYDLTKSALHLGLVGLAQFLPTLILTFYAGHVADRVDRKRVVQMCQWIEALTAGFLAWGTIGGWLQVAHIYMACVVFGAVTAFERPAGAAMIANVMPPHLLQQGTAMSSAALQLATICGPALGGLIYLLSPGAPYLACTGFWLIAGALNGAVATTRQAISAAATTWESLFAGVHFVWRNPLILGTISLDLFAVLLGGATALLPIYAAEVLHAGPVGLGLMRSAPAAGALLMTAMLARRPLQDRAGMRMFQAVIVFGLATLVFGASTQIWLSLVALVVMGAADEISVVIRMSLVQLRTPDEMRGRVSAVNFLFVNASNQLGEFRAGVTAAALGVVPAVLLGGLGSVAVALLWMKMFPSLRHLQRLA